MATIRASYTQDGVTVEGQKAIHIFALMGIEISGPDEVAENSSASYRAIAYYDNDSTKDVTDSVLWVVEPNTIASIEAGMLTTKDIIKDESAIIWVSYTEGETTFEAEKAIDILAICPTGTALSFDGVDDYVDVGDGFADFTNGLSIALWAYPDYDSTHERFIDFGNGEYNDNILFSRHHSTYSLVFQAYSGSEPGDWVLTEEVIELRTWQHFVVTVNSAGDTVIYKNGIEISNGKTFAPRNVLRTRNYIGRSNWVTESTYKGQLDEIEIFNRALSAEEIRANMHNRLTGDEPGLVGYWDFDEGQGQIVYDLSGNGNDGQLGSTPDIDASDPAWVKSDAPVGRCTPYLIATGAARNALKHKRASLQELEAAISQELTMYEAIEEWLKSGDYGDLDKGDIVTARQRTHSAIQHQEQSENALEISIEKLKDALSKLGYEFIPPNVNITYPLDGAELSCYQTIVVEAHAWDIDGSVVSVEFFADGTKIGEDNDGTDGWTTNWSDHPISTYTLTARAIDDDEAMTTSPAVTITLLETPGQATNPNPTDGATSVAVKTDLSWTAGINAVSHDVYFGTTSPGTFRGNQTATTFDTGRMTYNKTYYWRIDEVNPSGTTTGTVWTFKTRMSGWPGGPGGAPP